MSDERNLHPADAFASPADVLKARDLCDDDKVALLTSWANEIRLQLVAEEENMRGAPGLGEKLEAVEQALLALGHEDTPHDAKS